MQIKKVVLVGSAFILSSVIGRAEADDPCGAKLRVTQRIFRGESRVSQAIETLIATNLVDRDAQGDFQAGKSITLLPGFNAEQGSTFTAQVKSCSCEQGASFLEGGRLTLTAYPNPFVESTILRYRLTEASPVNLTILNQKGEQIDVLVNETSQEAGVYEFKYSNASLPESAYLYSLRTKKGVVTKRLIKGH
jgi:hypothetical protein